MNGNQSDRKPGQVDGWVLAFLRELLSMLSLLKIHPSSSKWPSSLMPLVEYTGDATHRPKRVP